MVKLLPGIGSENLGELVVRIFTEFDGIIDAQLQTGMTNEEVQRLILSMVVNAPAAAAAAAALPPPEVVAEIHPEPRNRKQTTFLTYDKDGNQTDEKKYRG